MNLSLTITETTETARSACLQVVGDLDYLTIDDFVDTASRVLVQQPGLLNLHLDFTGLTFLDSAALSGLLFLHRRTSQSGVQLHLDQRPAFLDRVLQVTGLYGHFVPSHSDAETEDSSRLDPVTSVETGVR